MKHTALKRVASFVLAVGMLVGCTSAFAATETPESSDAQSIGGIVQPRDKELYQGSHSGTQFTTTLINLTPAKQFLLLTAALSTLTIESHSEILPK